MEPRILSTTDTAGKRVLIVDDQSDIRRLCRIALSTLGINCDEAGTGPDAVALAAKSPYDLVLLDVDLPGFSGEEVLRRLRQRPSSPHCKVLIVSGACSREEMARMVDDGADGAIAKPFDVHELRSRVQAALRTKGAQDTAASLVDRLRSAGSDGADQEKNPIIHAIAEVTGGMCHDLANVLTGSSGNLELLREQSRLPAEAREYIDRALVTLNGARGIVRDLHRFVRPLYAASESIQEQVPGPRLARWLRSILPPETPELPTQFVIRVRGLPPQFRIPGVLARTLVTPLVANAVEASALERAHHSVRIVIGVSAVPGVNSIRLRVADNGPGWPVRVEEIASRLRSKSPFTSKGDGHGQGLVLVSRVVAKLGGTIALRSRRPVGASIDLMFPWNY